MNFCESWVVALLELWIVTLLELWVVTRFFNKTIKYIGGKLL